MGLLRKRSSAGSVTGSSTATPRIVNTNFNNNTAPSSMMSKFNPISAGYRVKKDCPDDITLTTGFAELLDNQVRTIQSKHKVETMNNDILHKEIKMDLMEDDLRTGVIKSPKKKRESKKRQESKKRRESKRTPITLHRRSNSPDLTAFTCMPCGILEEDDDNTAVDSWGSSQSGNQSACGGGAGGGGGGSWLNSIKGMFITSDNTVCGTTRSITDVDGNNKKEEDVRMTDMVEKLNKMDLAMKDMKEKLNMSEAAAAAAAGKHSNSNPATAPLPAILLAITENESGDQEDNNNISSGEMSVVAKAIAKSVVREVVATKTTDLKKKTPKEKKGNDALNKQNDSDSKKSSATTKDSEDQKKVAKTKIPTKESDSKNPSKVEGDVCDDDFVIDKTIAMAQDTTAKPNSSDNNNIGENVEQIFVATSPYMCGAFEADDIQTGDAGDVEVTPYSGPQANDDASKEIDKDEGSATKSADDKPEQTEVAKNKKSTTKKWKSKLLFKNDTNKQNESMLERNVIAFMSDDGGISQNMADSGLEVVPAFSMKRENNASSTKVGGGGGVTEGDGNKNSSKKWKLFKPDNNSSGTDNVSTTVAPKKPEPGVFDIMSDNGSIARNLAGSGLEVVPEFTKSANKNTVPYAPTPYATPTTYAPMKAAAPAPAVVRSSNTNTISSDNAIAAKQVYNNSNKNISSNATKARSQKSPTTSKDTKKNKKSSRGLSNLDGMTHDQKRLYFQHLQMGSPKSVANTKTSSTKKSSKNGKQPTSWRRSNGTIGYSEA